MHVTKNWVIGLSQQIYCKTHWMWLLIIALCIIMQYYLWIYMTLYILYA